MAMPEIIQVLITLILVLIFLAVVVVLTVPTLLLVHRGLSYCYLQFARRFCAKRGLLLSRWRCGPAFEGTGVRTEYWIVDLDCQHPQDGRQFVRLLVWIFGVRKVLVIEPFQEYDANEKLPRKSCRQNCESVI